jgi:rRNA biogenesis protein RRP5
MAPLQNKGKKRAAEDVTSSSKKVKSSSKPAASSSSGVAAAPPVYKSSLVADEVDFPRGGGSTLTPYEFKEATNEARQEADRDAKVEVRSRLA